MQVQLQYNLQSMPEVEGQVETYKVVVEVDGQVGTCKEVLLLLQENYFLQEVLYNVYSSQSRRCFPHPIDLSLLS